jgi:hypothetical protein
MTKSLPIRAKARMKLEEIIRGYESWIRQNSENGSKIYLVTFQFNHLSSNGEIALDGMKREIERFYATLVTNVVRRPRRASQIIKLPQLIAIPDRPVFKRVCTYRLADILPNNGLHVHALVTIPHKSRLQEDLVEHIQENEMRYRGNQGKIMKIDVRSVIDLNGALIDYTFKHIKRRTFSLDDILILPKSRSELEPNVRRQRAKPVLRTRTLHDVPVDLPQPIRF